MTARALPVLAVALLVGCGAEFSNDVLDRDGTFLDALPRAGDLQLSAPVAPAAEGATATLTQRLLAQPAELYVVTRRTTLQIDHGVFGLLRDIERIVEQPPTARTETTRTWGPGRHPLDPLESWLDVVRRDDGGYHYELHQRPAGTDGEGEAIIVGDAEPADAPVLREGSLVFDLDAQARISDSTGRGSVAVGYEVAADHVELVMALQGFVDAAVGGAPTNADYYYRRRPGLGGEFEFAFRGEQDELVAVRSRWDVTGAGRADARVSGPWPEPVLLSECWDQDFGSVWTTTTAPEPPDSGSQDLCVYEQAELPTRVSLEDPEP